jgi:hypothetical protein
LLHDPSFCRWMSEWMNGNAAEIWFAVVRFPRSKTGTGAWRGTTRSSSSPCPISPSPSWSRWIDVCSYSLQSEQKCGNHPHLLFFLFACIVVVARHDPFVRKHVMRPFSWRWSVFETFADPLLSVYGCYRNVSFGSFRFGRSLIPNVRGILGSTSSWPLCRYAHTIHRYSLPSSFWSLNKWISSTD